MWETQERLDKINTEKRHILGNAETRFGLADNLFRCLTKSIQHYFNSMDNTFIIHTKEDDIVCKEAMGDNWPISPDLEWLPFFPPNFSFN